MVRTATKIAIARATASTLLQIGVAPRRRITRKGVTYDIDIREGIDLSLFLFGSFQRHVVETVQRLVPPDGIVIDVGANIGAVTLPLAAYLDSGHVYAIEPTDYAFEKLRVNLALNDSLTRRVTAVKTFVADQSGSTSHLVAYSSWPVTDIGSRNDRHPVHGGVAQDADCGQITLDEFMQRHAISRVDLIKIDTDGHEYAVLSGADQCLDLQRPFIVFEACEYLMRRPQPDFGDFAKLFARHRYTICYGSPPRPIDAVQFYRACPEGGGLDLIAVPSEKFKALSSAE